MLTLGNGGGLFADLKADALESWSRCEAATKGRLLEASRLGDRLALIEAVSEALLPAARELQRGCHAGKDEARARQLLERGDLSEALAWAPPAGKLFARILARRIRHWRDSGALARCARDCRLAARGDREAPEEEVVEEAVEEAVEAVEGLVLRADCSRAGGESPELGRALLNEAMRRINELAAACPGEDPRALKARILESCLPGKPAAAAAAAAPVPRRRRPAAPTGPPQLQGREHERLSCCSDALAVGRDSGARGRFLYARRNIKPGSVLIVDRPFSFSTDISALGTNCTNCHLSFRLDDDGVTQIPCETCSTVRYCSEECRQSAWHGFHKYECQIFGYFYEHDLQKCNALLAYRTVVAACLRVESNGQLRIDEDFLRLHEHDEDIIDVTCMQEKYEPNNYKTVFSLETHCAQREFRENLEDAIHSIFLTKCLIYSLRHLGLELNYQPIRKLEITMAVGFLHNIQAIKCNAYEIVENIRNEETKILEPRNVGGAIYTSVSLTNHSCYPNIVRHSFPSGVVVVTSLRFIPQGDEILDCYGQHFLENERDHRRRHLKVKYYFECKCEACLFDWPIKLQSNEFRFKCKRCSKQCRKLGNAIECKECGLKTGISKTYNLLQSSIEKRIAALTKMYDGCYDDALLLLLEHANCIGKILSEPSLEAVKTQQSIIQCLNALSCTSV